MPLTKEEKDYIVNKVVDILKAPNKKELIGKMRERVVGATSENNNDEAIYAVIQAIEELYG